jgi:hypothetical protein
MSAILNRLNDTHGLYPLYGKYEEESECGPMLEILTLSECRWELHITRHLNIHCTQVIHKVMQIVNHFAFISIITD